MTGIDLLILYKTTTPTVNSMRLFSAKMAELSSIAVIKGRKRTPSLRALESVHMSSLPRLQRVNVEPRNKLYDITIIEELDDKVKVHYVGYPEKFDEWMDRSDVYRKPSSLGGDTELPPSHLSACYIKQKLLPRKLDDPAVKVYMPYSIEAFQEIAVRGKSVGVVRGYEHYTIQDYEALADLLGEQWYLRIANTNGDFSYVILETVDFHLFQPKPLLDYSAVRDPNGSLKFQPAYIDQGHSLCFSFVHGDGNRHKLEEFL